MIELQQVALAGISSAQALAQLACLRDLVRGEDDAGLLTGSGDLASQGRLALGAVLDRGVVADRRHEPGDALAEAARELGLLDVSVLEHIVEHAGGDHLLGVAGLVQQAATSTGCVTKGTPGLSRVCPACRSAAKASASRVSGDPRRSRFAPSAHQYLDPSTGQRPLHLGRRSPFPGARRSIDLCLWILRERGRAVVRIRRYRGILDLAEAVNAG